MQLTLLACQLLQNAGKDPLKGLILYVVIEIYVCDSGTTAVAILFEMVSDRGPKALSKCYWAVRSIPRSEVRKKQEQLT